MPSRRIAVMLSGVAAMALVGCREDVARPPEPLFVPAATAEAYGLPLAPALEALPPAPPAPVQMAAYQPDYGYAERAYAMDQAFYDAPPDYGFSYVDAQPWAWRSHDGYEMFVEPIDDGYRYYYYEPGAEYPFFVRAPDYGYGYDPGGVLTVVYSTAGVILPYGYLNDQAPRAGRYWTRAHALRSAARHRRAPVVYDAWLSRRPTFIASQSPWLQAAVREDKWRRHRDREDAKELRRFERERERRADALARLERDEVRQALRRREADDGRRLVAFERERREQVEHRRDRDERLERAAAQVERRPDRDQRADREARRERVAHLDARQDRPDRSERRRSERLRPAAPPTVERAERQPRMERSERREARADRPPRQQVLRPERRREDGQRIASMDRPEQSAQRFDRPERREARPERAERREARTERQARAPEARQPQHAKRSDRPEPAARGAKAEHVERREARPERQGRAPEARQQQHAKRSDRPEPAARGAKPERRKD